MTAERRGVTKWAALIAACTMVGIIVLVAWGAGLDLLDRSDGSGKSALSFQQSDWQSWECCKDTTRLRMTDDVQKRIAGARFEDVLELLGPSEISDENLHWARGCGDCLVYRLGLEPGLIRVDPNHLIVRFEDGRVVETFIQ